MLSELFFDKCFTVLLDFYQVPVDEKKSRMFYKLMANDFTDIEFQNICSDICKTENLFGKYPTPVMFYSRKITKDDISVIACDDFLLKVDIYLSSNYICDGDKEKFINGLTQTEKNVLARYGGISSLWKSCHREDYSRSIDNVLNELREDFMNIYRLEAKIDYPLIESDRNIAIAEKTQKLISSAIKKL
jgi:hypothetical protein